MKIVMTFGSFDVIHQGHKYYLSEAKKYGDLLITIIARNVTIEKFKGKSPLHDEKKRLNDIKKLKISNKVELGHKTDMLHAIKKYKPDVIALGYDQSSFIHHLSEYLLKNKLKTSVVTIDAYKPEIYKSSKIKKNLQ